MSAIAIIVARGGSKRFPGKNIAKIRGKPMLAYDIEAAQRAELVDFVVVSTDSDDIADVAMRWGARVVERSPELASDTATIYEAAAEAVNLFFADEFRHEADDPRGRPETTAIIQANCPVWREGTLDSMIRMAETSRFTGVAAVHPVREHPEWMQKMGPSGSAIPFLEVVEESFRQQDLPEKFRLDGQVMVLPTDALLNGQQEPGVGLYHWMGARMGLYVREWIYGLDVDEPWDLALAEAALKWLENNEPS